MTFLQFILKWLLHKKFEKWLFILLFQFCISSYFAANRFWIATTTGNCNNSANWSTTSGGSGGASVPTNLDNVIFDGAGGANGNCIINVNATITNMTVTSAYTGTISQSTGISFVINGSSVWSGGTFLGGNASITNAGAITISGTQFTSTSNTLIVRGNFNFSSGTFNHNNGTVDFQNNNFSISGSPVFYNLKNTPNYNTLTINSSFTVANNFTLSGSGASSAINAAANSTITLLGNLYKIGDNYVQYNTGLIDVKGDVNVSNTASGNGGTGTISITGSSAQLLNSSAAAQYGRLPSIRINKPSGTLTLTGTLTVGGPNWNYVSGSLDATNSTVYFYNEPGGTYISIAGTHTLNNVMMYPYYSTNTISGNLTVNNFTIDGSSSSIIHLSSSLTVNGNLYMTGTDQLRINNGLLNAKADVIISNTNLNGGGTGTLQLSGTANQTLTNSGLILTGKLPNVFINKPSGILSLNGIITSVGPNWNYISGSIDPGSSTVVFFREPGGSNINVTGTHTLNNVSLTSYYSTATIANTLTVNNFTVDAATTQALTISSALNVNGALTLSGSDVLTLNTGTIHVKGNISNLNTHTNSGGTAVLNINGTSNQSLTGTGVTNQSKLPNTVILNKPSGNLLISGGVPFYIYNTLNFTQGILVSTTSQALIFAAGASVTGTPSNTCYVDGPVRKIGNTAFTFPTGKNNFYAPVSISSPTNVAHAFTAEYFNSDPHTSYSVTLKDPSINHVSRCEYWDLQRTTGTSNVYVTLSWDSPRTCVVNNLSDLRVVHWDLNLPTPIWKDMGIGTVTGNSNTGSIQTNTLVTSFSPFSLGSSSSFNPLPITLSSFEGHCLNNEVQLSWVTSSELNNEYFEVEKSSNGSEWQTIQKVKGHGTTTSKQYYSAIDNNPSPGLIYYRLKQIDKSGTEFNNTAAIVIKSCEEAQTQIALFPNPVKSSFHFNNYEKDTEFTILIHDHIGQLLFNKKFYENEINIDLHNFENGSYLITYISNTQTKSIPIRLLKD